MGGAATGIGTVVAGRHGHARLGEGRDRVGVRASPRGLLSGLLSGR